MKFEVNKVYIIKSFDVSKDVSRIFRKCYGCFEIVCFKCFSEGGIVYFFPNPNSAWIWTLHTHILCYICKTWNISCKTWHHHFFLLQSFQYLLSSYKICYDSIYQVKELNASWPLPDGGLSLAKQKLNYMRLSSFSNFLWWRAMYSLSFWSTICPDFPMLVQYRQAQPKPHLSWAEFIIILTIA